MRSLCVLGQVAPGSDVSAQRHLGGQVMGLSVLGQGHGVWPRRTCPTGAKLHKALCP